VGNSAYHYEVSQPDVYFRTRRFTFGTKEHANQQRKGRRNPRLECSMREKHIHRATSEEIIEPSIGNYHIHKQQRRTENIDAPFIIVVSEGQESGTT